MYRVLDLYTEKYDKDFPVVCFDEKSKQLLADSRKPIPLKPGRTKRYDYEYKRNGTCNIFVAVEPKAGKHYIKVTDRRTRQDFSQFMKWLIDENYKDAKKIRIVLDNLNTHFEISFECVTYQGNLSCHFQVVGCTYLFLFNVVFHVIIPILVFIDGS